MSKQPRYDDLSRTELFQGTYAKNYIHDSGLDIFWGFEGTPDITGTGRWGFSVVKDGTTGMATGTTKRITLIVD